MCIIQGSGQDHIATSDRYCIRQEVARSDRISEIES